MSIQGINKRGAGPLTGRDETWSGPRDPQFPGDSHCARCQGGPRSPTTTSHLVIQVALKYVYDAINLTRHKLKGKVNSPISTPASFSAPCPSVPYPQPLPLPHCPIPRYP